VNKKAKVCVLAVALFGLGFGSQAISSGIPWPALQNFVVEGGVWGLNLVLFIFGSVLIMGAGQGHAVDKDSIDYHNHEIFDSEQSPT
jgi:hypothetical protein